MCSLGSVWYITHGCGSYPALPYPGKRPFQPYTVLGTQGNSVPFHSLPWVQNGDRPRQDKSDDKQPKWLPKRDQDKRSEARRSGELQVIHVILAWNEIMRSAIFGRQIGVPDREVFSRQKIQFQWHKLLLLAL